MAYLSYDFNSNTESVFGGLNLTNHLHAKSEIMSNNYKVKIDTSGSFIGMFNNYIQGSAICEKSYVAPNTQHL